MGKTTYNRPAKRGVAAALTALLLLTACASTPPPPGANYTDGSRDPLEGYNRFMFKVNDAVDRNAVEPVAKGYRDYIPNFIRTGVHNFLVNLHEPINAANNLLQGDLKGTGTDIARFGINTTVGIAGLFDVAGANQLSYRSEDFGQTLGVWGVGPGPYFVIPLLGPSDIRDGTGMIVDSVADPIDLYLYSQDLTWLVYVRGGFNALDARTQLLGAVDDLRRNSMDFYAATRSAYLQARQSSIRNNRVPTASDAPIIPTYDSDHP